MTSVLIVSAVFPPEPVVSAKLSLEVATALQNKGNRVTVIAPPPTRPMGFIFEDILPSSFPFEYIRVNTYTCPQSSFIGRIKESHSFGLAIKKHLEQNPNKYQVIYANTWPLFSQWLLVNTAKKLNIPVVLHIQDVYPESLSSKLSIFSGIINQLVLPADRYILKNSAHIIAISEQMKNYLSSTRNISNERFSVVFNWQNEEEFLTFHQNHPAVYNNNVFTFMYLGNIGPVAGVEHLIESFVKANIPNSRLIIAGSGSLKSKMQQLVLQHQINTIEFWDVPNGKVPETQHKADVLLLPMKKGSGKSSIPSKLPAYMFSKKPVIACVDSDSETARCIRESGGGKVIAPENIDELVATLKAFAAKSKQELQTMGENGFTFALNYLSKKSNLDNLINCIEKAKNGF
jgi:glycosyltransferase involved in cell wall biosynthesis